jgi:hypothetical protein
MELEMLEPGLFLLNEPAAAKRFARVIRERIGRGRGRGRGTDGSGNGFESENENESV